MHTHKRALCTQLFAMCTIIFLSQIKSDFHQTWNLTSLWGTKHKTLFTLGLCAHMHAHKGVMCTLLFAMCEIIYLSHIRSDFHKTWNLTSFWGTKHKTSFTLGLCAHMHTHKGALCTQLFAMCTIMYLSQIKSVFH